MPDVNNIISRLQAYNPDVQRQEPQGLLGRMLSGISDLVTGDDRREFDLPSVGGGLAPAMAAEGELYDPYAGTGLTPEAMRRTGQLGGAIWGGLLAQDDAALADVVRSNFPDAEWRQDSYGNPIVIIEGNPYYLNRPGLDATEVGRYGPLLAAGLGGAAAIGRAVTGLLPRALAVGGYESALSAGADLSAQIAGSEQPVSLERMGLAALGGFGGEYAGYAVSRLLQAFGPRAVTTAVNPTTGQVTLQFSPEAQAALRNAGVDPDALSRQWIEEFRATAQRTLSPEEAMRRADLTTLPVPVPYSRGDVTRRASDQMAEDLMRKGGYGPLAESRFRDLRALQDEALQANALAIQRQIGGGVVTQPGIGGAMVSTSLNRIRDRLLSSINQAYEAARLSPTGGLPPHLARGLAFDMAAAPRVADTIAFAPRAASALEDFNALVTRAGDGEVLIRSMFDWRRRVSNLRDGADATDGGALRELLRTFDDRMRTMVDAALFSGDDASVELWRRAIGERAEFGRLFQGDDLVERLTERDYRSGAMTLAVPPDQAANYIFGLHGIGAGRLDLARDLARLRDILAQNGDTAAWHALREEAFGRLIRQAQGIYDLQTTGRSFSGAKFASAIDSAVATNKPLIDVLFTPQEMALIEQFKRAALAVTTRTTGGQNTSNTALGLGRMFGDYLGGPLRAMFTGPIAALAQQPLINVAPTVIGGVRAAGRTSGNIVTQPAPAAGMLGGAGGVMLYPTDQMLGLLDMIERGQVQGQ